MPAVSDLVTSWQLQAEEVPQKISPEALSLVLAAHRRHGYETGYRRAIADVLAAAVFVAEKSLITARDPADSRQVIYRFIELLEKETVRYGQSDQTVSDGLGI